jgi:hypothetical protein
MPTLAVKLTPGSLLDFVRVAPLLRSELLHVEDMLDPDFGYERDLPSFDVDAVYEKLVRDRYRDSRKPFRFLGTEHFNRPSASSLGFFLS